MRDDRASTVRQAAAYPRGPEGSVTEVARPRCQQTGGPAVADTGTRSRSSRRGAGAPGRLSLRELSMDSLLQTVADLTKR